MKTPIILSYKTLQKSGELNEAYLRAIQGCGGELKMLESAEEIDAFIEQADGVLLPGGHDVNPALYGEERRHVESTQDERDLFEMYLVEKAMEKELPVLGICRGLQLINVKLGGTLYQDLEKEMPGSIRHDWHKDNDKDLPRSQKVHPVSIVPGSKLGAIVGDADVEVNSLHHQGIKELGKGLVAAAHSSDGLIEGFEMLAYPYLLAVQWHPEEMQDTPAWKNLLQDFVNRCAKAD